MSNAPLAVEIVGSGLLAACEMFDGLGGGKPNGPGGGGPEGRGGGGKGNPEPVESGLSAGALLFGIKFQARRLPLALMLPALPKYKTRASAPNHGRLTSEQLPPEYPLHGATLSRFGATNGTTAC